MRIGENSFLKRDNYLTFLEYPQEVRKHIYSTNAVESINFGLERMVTELEGYFPSQRSLEIKCFYSDFKSSGQMVEKTNVYCKSC